MKRITNRSIVAMLVLLGSMLITVDSYAQRQKQFVADTGVINLEANHKLRVIVTPTSDNQTYRIRYRRCLYTEQDGAFVVASTMISPILMIPSTEARFFDIFTSEPGQAVRARVASNSPNVVVTFQLIDTSTGEIEWGPDAIVTEQDIWATPN